MTPHEAMALCLRAHYHLMENPRYWYDKAIKDASRMLVVAASDVRQELQKERLTNVDSAGRV